MSDVYYRIVENSEIPLDGDLSHRIYELDGNLMCDALVWKGQFENTFKWRGKRDYNELANYLYQTDIVLDDNIGPGYDRIRVDDNLSDSEKSSVISNALGFTQNPCLIKPYYRNQDVIDYWKNEILAGRVNFTYDDNNENLPLYYVQNPRAYPTFYFDRDDVVKYALWAEIHNKLMVNPNKIFPWSVFMRRNGTPECFCLFTRRDFPGSAASIWKGYWFVSESNNGVITRREHFKTFEAGVKKVSRYIKRNFETTEIPDFRYNPFCHEGTTINFTRNVAGFN